MADPYEPYNLMTPQAAYERGFTEGEGDAETSVRLAALSGVPEITRAFLEGKADGINKALGRSTPLPLAADGSSLTNRPSSRIR